MEVSLQVNPEEVLSMAEAAKFMNIAPDSMRELVCYHKKMLWDYIAKQKHNCTISGQNRKMRVITKKGLVVLANIKDGMRNRKTWVRPSFVENALESKKKLAEIAITKVEQPNLPVEFLNDPFIQLRLKQIDQEKRMVNMEIKIEEVKQLALETPPAEMVTSQREFLNDRLRNFCIQTEMSHSYVWLKLHNFTGKKSINDYQFEDYKPAIKYLKKMYQDSNIAWT